MSGAPDLLARHAEILRCPGCRGGIEVSAASLACQECGHRFEIEGGVPRLFWPDGEIVGQQALTDTVKSFYEQTPFPDYNDFDSVATLAERAREGIFPRMLDEQLPPGTRILECGCGTGQLSNFLSIASRTVFATDMCVNSLRLGEQFARDHDLRNIQFAQMNLFRPAFEYESFDLVICNGVLMTTVDPLAGFRSIARLVKPGGYVLIGLYHRYGRLVTDLRRLVFRFSGDRLQWLDPVLRDRNVSAARKRAWFADQYKHPHEMKHTIGQMLHWLDDTGFRFVKSIPRSRPFREISAADDLFRPEAPGNAFERLIVELGMIGRGRRDNGFFTVIGQKT